MSEHSNVYIGRMCLDSVRDDMPWDVMTVFDESERVRVRGPDADWLDAKRLDRRVRYAYRANSRVMAERLSLMGYSSRRAEAAIERAIRVGPKEVDNPYSRDIPELARRNQRISRLLARLSLRTWQKAMKHAIRSARDKTAAAPRIPRALLSLVVDGLSESVPELGLLFGLYVNRIDYLNLLRAAVDLVPDESVVVDYTELVHGEYYTSRQNLAGFAKQDRFGGATSGRAVVLTEGSSDAKVLAKALTLFAPHVASYFSFLDLDRPTPIPGGSNLVHYARALSRARIPCRVIVVCDNDTAGQEMAADLSADRLAPGMRVLTLPRIGRAQNYPTVGPSGRHRANINGKACGLEMYACDDLLRDESGRQLPIRWTSYNRKVGEYHGELTGKRDVLKGLERLLDEAIRDRTQLDRHDWSAMRSVVASIVKAACS